MSRKDEDWDFRGDILNDDASCTAYMTFNTPNSGIDYIPCVDKVKPAPCQSQYDPTYVSARSRHPGGVNVLFGDGSVHFLTDSMAQALWVSLGTMEGGEPGSADF